MSRTVKPPEVRRAEILDTANSLFGRQGYGQTTVDEIVRAMGVAKGTFYHYFRTKEEILAALATRLVERMAMRLQEIAQDAKRGPIEKLQAMFGVLQQLAADDLAVVGDLHRPENRELHERNNIETVRVLGPIIADVVEQGKKKGIFDVEDSTSTVQFLMAGSLFLFGEGVFNWTSAERAARMTAMRKLIARSLGMKQEALAMRPASRRKRRGS